MEDQKVTENQDEQQVNSGEEQGNTNQNENENGEENQQDNAENQQDNEENQQYNEENNEENNEEKPKGEDETKKKSNKRDIYGHNEIIITKDSYIMNDSKGGKIKMTKEDLDKISCLKLFREKTSGVKNNEEKNENGQQTENENQTHREENKDGKNEKAEQLKRMLRKELNEAIKTTKLKEKLNNKEKRYQNLQDIRNKGK